MKPITNQPAPAFTLQDQSGTSHSLADYAGQYVVLYFYPRDNTPGCTLEAKQFSDLLPKFADANAVVLGVSADSVQSHQKFSTSCDLGVTLLSDPDHAVAEAYGVWVPKKMFGKEFLGIQRDTFLISPDGTVHKHYAKVTPQTHAADVLADIQQAAA